MLFTRVKGSPFPALSNLYGTYERARFLFRDTFPLVEQVVRLKADPMAILRHPWLFRRAPFAALHGLPLRRKRAPILHGTTRIDQLPLIKSWPDDGGAFVTLPQVVTLPPGSQRIMSSNVGMYRIQLSGNDYQLNREVGLHYQLHRGIGVHHTQYNRTDNPFRATICIGGPPANAFSAIMPLPEGLSELHKQIDFFPRCFVKRHAAPPFLSARWNSSRKSPSPFRQSSCCLACPHQSRLAYPHAPSGW